MVPVPTDRVRVRLAQVTIELLLVRYARPYKAKHDPEGSDPGLNDEGSRKPRASQNIRR